MLPVNAKIIQARVVPILDHIDHTLEICCCNQNDFGRAARHLADHRRSKLNSIAVLVVGGDGVGRAKLRSTSAVQELRDIGHGRRLELRKGARGGIASSHACEGSNGAGIAIWHGARGTD